MPAKCPHCQHLLPEPPQPPGRHRLRCQLCGGPVAAAPGGSGTRPRVLRLTARRSGVQTAPGRTAVDTPLPPERTPVTPVGRPAVGSVPALDDDGPADPPAKVSGYRIERVLGHGGMGTVYLARQLSLDRPVALKVMSKRWVGDPVFVARFTREAFAAAQLNHPNVVQIYDVGEADGTRYFSMEYVPGRTLADVVKAEGKLDPETAVGYILQAARGLRHAHDRGMIHRDIKPDNLILDDQGIVKVADLGLVKTPGPAAEGDRPADTPRGLRALPPDITGTRIALGTPAYMAPEQCRDAAAVDHRADVYALGATLYVLVTGRPPFDGSTAVELMTKQAYAPLTPPEVHVNRVPKELSAIIQKMMAKEPGDRYADMGELVRTLEQWLGVYRAGTFSPREDQIDQVERFVRQFNEVPSAQLRGRLLAGAASAFALAAVLLMFFGRIGWAFGLAGLVLQGALAYFALNGLAKKTYLFRRVRQFAFGLSVGDWAVAVAAVGLFGVLLWLMGLFWVWAGFGLAGVALAAALRYGLDKRVERERRGPLEACERLLRRLRLHGADEEELRQFVAKYGGRDWEEFYEALFGYEAKLAARAVLLRGGSAGAREKFAGWREPLVALIDRVEKARQEARARRLLEQVEKARLLAAGLAEPAAGEQASAAAALMAQHAHAARYVDPSRRTMGPAARTPVSLPAVVQLLARSGPVALPKRADPTRPPDRLDRLVGLLVGPPVRAALAAVLLAGCVLWACQNRLFGPDLALPAARAVEPEGPGTTPLALGGVPAEWTGWCDSANVGWAGVLLLASLFFRGHRTALLTVLGAAVVVLGHHLGIRTVEPIRDYHVSWLLGSVFALVGYRLGRR